MTRFRSLNRCVTGAASCLLIGGLYFAASPAKADLSNPFAYPTYERARPSADHVRKYRKPKNNRSDIKTNKQPIPPGPLQVVVSITKQRAILFANGVRVADGPISTGVPGHPTPMGVFSVIAKARYHRSNIYSGAPMPFMQRITWSGIALHQGPLPGFPASHGCIRLTQAFAVKLWAATKIGARVIVTRDEVAPGAIESNRLFVPKKPEEKPADNVAELPVMAMATEDTAEPASATDAGQQPAAPKPITEPQKPKGPVQVFVSRKEAKLYVRQGFTPLFDAPVTIAEPDKPWGTHVYTVMDITDEKATWNALTIPSGYTSRMDRRNRKVSAKEIERQQKRTTELANAPTAAEALERFVLPKDAVDRISELLAPGSSLIVSDNALSNETGTGTDFIVLTR